MSVHPPGVGSLTVSSNLQWSLARHCQIPTCLLNSSCLGWAEVQVCPLHKTSSPCYWHGDVYRCLLLQWCPRAGSQMPPSVPLWAETGAEDGIHCHHSQNVLQKCCHWLPTHVTLLVRAKGGTKGHIHDTTQFVLELTSVAGL